MDYRNFFQINSHICDKGVGAPLLGYSGFCFLEGACSRKTGSRFDSYDGALFLNGPNPASFLFIFVLFTMQGQL